MEPLPRNLARFAGLCVAVCAAIGLYLGASKAYSGSADNQNGVTTSADHVASAKAIAPPPPPTFDEAAIRRIAKEEAQNLVGRAQASAAPAPSRRRSSGSSATQYTSPSDAGLVYARPPRTDAPPAPSSPPSQVEQF